MTGEKGFLFMITKEQKKEIIEKFGKNITDSGCPAVQVALLTKRIENLTPHFGEHKKDFHSKRGLFKLIGQRRSLLRYIMKKDVESYKGLIKELGLRK